MDRCIASPALGFHMRISYLLQIKPNLDLNKLQFRADEVSDLVVIVPFVLLGIIVIGAAISLFFYLRRREAVEEINRIREETRVKLMISEFSLGLDEQQFLVELTGSNSPGRREALRFPWRFQPELFHKRRCSA